MNLLHFGPQDDRELETEIMRSDRLRAAVLAVAFLVVALLFLVFWSQVWRFEGSAWGLLTKLPYPVAIGALAFLAVYEGGYRWLTGQLMTRGLRLPLPARFVNATLEISLPTLLLALIATAVPAETALNLPPLFVYFFFLALSTLRLDPRLAFFTGVVAGVEYAGLAWVLLQGAPSGELGSFLGGYVSKGAMLVITGGLLAFVTYQLRLRVVGLLRTREQQSKMAAIFGQHVSPAVMEKLLNQKTNRESEVRHVTVMFLDVRNFTSFSENRGPAEVVEYLNRLFGFMVDAVNEHHGIINKFLGDGFMAVFGAPLNDGQSELDALKASLQISDLLKAALTAGLEPTRIGIGLHAGAAVTGNVGSSLRQEYTIIGDVVNLASRIESHTKAIGAEILVSQDVWTAVQAAEPEIASGVLLGPVTVKGRETPVALVQIR